MGHMGDGVLLITRLENLLKEQSSDRQLVDLVQDSRRFILQNRWVIENAPLQTYESALIFSPANSLLRKIFENEEPNWIKIKPIVESAWSSCQQTLAGHSDWVSCIAFSPDAKLIASGSSDHTVKLWDTATGALEQTLAGHGDWVFSIAFSPDAKLIASGSGDRTVKLWDTATGALQQTFDIGAAITNLSFDNTSSRLDTDIGRLELANRTEASSRAPVPEQAQRHEYGLSHDKSWITWNEHNVLWLPPDCRFSTSAISYFAMPSTTTTVTMIALGCLSGRVMLIGLLGSGPSSVS
ncbi:putative wd40 repeat pf20 [Emericellopsis atlantica]|uniref:Wd40 repeat pf20 n=1 Tax=Emericellopsis atlantica TaxID=2614577 RepID=A0A9P8CMP0_9HYPO|nr:putative wd40 repeat pf20 [Emericellopsis atlantica]KAG9252899.1 putative wd40 repeat pf20 [Emericellopsis atlantica]